MKRGPLTVTQTWGLHWSQTSETFAFLELEPCFLTGGQVAKPCVFLSFLNIIYIYFLCHWSPWKIQNQSAVHRTRGMQSLLVVTVLGSPDEDPRTWNLPLSKEAGRSSLHRMSHILDQLDPQELSESWEIPRQSRPVTAQLWAGRHSGYAL